MAWAKWGPLNLLQSIQDSVAWDQQATWTGTGEVTKEAPSRGLQSPYGKLLVLLSSVSYFLAKTFERTHTICIYAKLC